MKHKLFVYLFLLLPLALYANGGITVYSWTNGSGNPSFKTVKDVSIISESLDITLNKTTSTVKVTYLLWNNSDIKYTNEDYGFPVDYYASESNDYHMELTWNESYISDLRFKLNDVSLSHISSDTLISLRDKKYSDSNSLHRRWFYTQITILPHSLTKLEVYYTIKNHTSTDGHSPVNLWMLDAGMENRFSYDFSPAKHWHDGVIRDFFIRIDASNLTTTENENPPFGVDHEKVGYTFEACGGQIYTFKARNFDLNNAPKLNINYWIDKVYDAYNTLQVFYLPHNKYTLTASGSLANHPVSNLQDMNLETAWAIKNGVGEWLEFDFSKNYLTNNGTDDHEFLSGFTIVNGYNKNEKTYLENNIIKRLAVVINPDDEQPIEFIISLERIPYQKIYFKSIFDRFHKSSIAYTHDFFDDFNNMNKIKKLRLKILEVDKGSKYDELCVSEIILLQ